MEVLIERLNDQGLGICYFNNIITFVPNTVIGDLVDVEVIEKYKKYNIGKVIKYIKKSINRIESICPYSTLCGGCALLNINYDMGLESKKNKVKNILKKFIPTAPPDSEVLEFLSGLNYEKTKRNFKRFQDACENQFGQKVNSQLILNYING